MTTCRCTDLSAATLPCALCPVATSSPRYRRVRQLRSGPCTCKQKSPLTHSLKQLDNAKRPRSSREDRGRFVTGWGYVDLNHGPLPYQGVDRAALVALLDRDLRLDWT